MCLRFIGGNLTIASGRPLCSFTFRTSATLGKSEARKNSLSPSFAAPLSTLNHKLSTRFIARAAPKTFSSSVRSGMCLRFIRSAMCPIDQKKEAPGMQIAPETNGTTNFSLNW